MKVAQQPQRYFNQNQFLLADSAYPSNQYVIPAYKGKELLVHDNVDFNYYLAQSRVRIEHAIGILKGRFSTLPAYLAGMSVSQLNWDAEIWFKLGWSQLIKYKSKGGTLYLYLISWDHPSLNWIFASQFNWDALSPASYAGSAVS